jgi:hypothetical protein
MLTVKDIYNLKEGLEIIGENDYPISFAYKLQKISLKVEEEYQVASKLRMKIIEKYDEHITDGVVAPGKPRENFSKEIKELMEQEVKVKLDTIKLSDLGEKIKPKTLVLLDKIIKEG